MSIKFTNEQYERYEAAMHAMQSGVAMDHVHGSDDGSPKHLRVGVNSAMMEAAVLAGLLVEKGVFTAEEYIEAVIAGAEREKERYEKRLSAKLGKKITLG